MLNKVAKIAIPDDVLDMSGATEDVETTVDITSYLPDGTSLVLAADAKVEVKVKVEPITTKTFEVDASAFTLENIPDATKAKITEDTIQVEVTGAESDIKKLSADDITGTVNLQGYGNGEHNIAADIDVDNELYQVKTVRIPVKMTAEDTEIKSTESDKRVLLKQNKEINNLEKYNGKNVWYRWCPRSGWIRTYDRACDKTWTGGSLCAYERAGTSGNDYRWL